MASRWRRAFGPGGARVLVRSHADELSHETGAQEPLRAIVAIGVPENAAEGDHGRHARQT